MREATVPFYTCATIGPSCQLLWYEDRAPQTVGSVAGFNPTATGPGFGVQCPTCNVTYLSATKEPDVVLGP